MKENDFDFINQVTEYFYSTVDKNNPKGNISKVMEKYDISRTKVIKILITSGAIDSPLHQDIMKLKNEGYDVDDIAAALNVSITTVKTNMPYEKVIYGGKEKSVGATYTENFRNREKIFMEKVVRKPSDLEIMLDYQGAKLVQSVKDIMGIEWKEDIVNLEPKFTEEDTKLFKIPLDVMLLHIELDEEVPITQRKICGIKYGNTISRDIIVPIDMPLHNLHYMINQAFGFKNSHLHKFELTDEDYKWVTKGDFNNWKKLIGLIFRNPVRDENIDFWDDDYHGGSPKKWMRSKYTGPIYRKCYEESYRYICDESKNISMGLDKLYEFEIEKKELSEILSLYNIFDIDQNEKITIEEWYEELNDSIEEANCYEDMDTHCQPWVTGFAKKLIYTYDFGDYWTFSITPKFNIEYLLKDKRVSEKEVKEAIKKVCTLARPVIIGADGYQLVDDCGGLYGFIDMIKKIEDNDEEMIDWAYSMGWKKKIDKNAL